MAQFACTSLWFAGNAIIADIQVALQLSDDVLGHITSAVQLGFIFGTLVFAIFSISDRFSPSKVFFVCALAGGISNLSIYFIANGLWSLLFLRFSIGFFLAGVYPVGMKIAADYQKAGLGKLLGYLVGALVLGTAFPHLLKTFGKVISWERVIFLTTGLSIIGGLLIFLFVPDGPFRKKQSKVDFTGIFKVFKVTKFRTAAFGYFGHMWELYAFWAFVPVILFTYQNLHPEINFSTSLFSFIIIGFGAISCVIGGYLSAQYGSYKVAFYSLLGSGICCLLSPIAFFLPLPLFLAFLILWGLFVIADSPQFSTLVAQSAPANSVGTALTIVNSIGFGITIFSIELLNTITPVEGFQYVYLFLVIGPMIGVGMLWKGRGLKSR